jgi:hypothetical protein
VRERETQSQKDKNLKPKKKNSAEEEKGSVYPTLKRWNVTEFSFECLNDYRI